MGPAMRLRVREAREGSVARFHDGSGMLDGGDRRGPLNAAPGRLREGLADSTGEEPRDRID